MRRPIDAFAGLLIARRFLRVRGRRLCAIDLIFSVQHESSESISGATSRGTAEATLGIYQIATPRSVTQPIFIKSPPTTMLSTDVPTSPSIASRLSALQKNGSDEWKHRVKKDDVLPVILRQKNVDSPDRSSIVKDRVSKLIDSSALWHHRVSDKDTDELTVNGKLERAGLIVKLTATPTNRRHHDKNLSVGDDGTRVRAELSILPAHLITVCLQINGTNDYRRQPKRPP